MERSRKGISWPRAALRAAGLGPPSTRICWPWGVVIRMAIDDISRMGRATQGVRIMKLDEEDQVASIAQLASQEGLPEPAEESQGEEG